MNDEKKIEQLTKEVEKLKKSNTLYLLKIEELNNKKPETALKILSIIDKNNLSKEQKKQIIQECINLANSFRKENKKINK